MITLPNYFNATNYPPNKWVSRGMTGFNDYIADHLEESIFNRLEYNFRKKAPQKIR